MCSLIRDQRLSVLCWIMEARAINILNGVEINIRVSAKLDNGLQGPKYLAGFNG